MIFLISFLIGQILVGQINLVPNSSFETYTACPSNFGQLNSTVNWYQPTNGTPDYFNTCATSTSVMVPLNLAGYQNPKNGNGYTGLLLFNKPFEWREYLQARLSSPLIVNKKYYVSVYVSLSDSSRYATDDFGIFFSQLPINQSSNLAFNYTPQINNPSGYFLNDMNNWINISGSFISSGNEEYVTVGNFKGDLNTDTLRVLNSQPSLPGAYLSAYYYLDDICISNDSIMCDYFASIKESKNENKHLFYYNSNTKTIFFQEQDSYEIEVMSLLGDIKHHYKSENSKSFTLPCESSGCFILTVFNFNKQYSRKKIVIN